MNLTLYENHFLFEIVTDVIEMVGISFWFLSFSFLEAEKNKLEGQMSQFRQEVGCHLNVLHMVAMLCKCFMFCTCYHMPYAL